MPRQIANVISHPSIFNNQSRTRIEVYGSVTPRDSRGASTQWVCPYMCSPPWAAAASHRERVAEVPQLRPAPHNDKAPTVALLG